LPVILINTKSEDIEMKKYFAPGCALYLYKPELANKILTLLTSEFDVSDEHKLCCHHDPRLPEGSIIINTCPGCNKRYSTLYDEISTISLWEILAESHSFPFPDYNGRKMSILDACPTRGKDKILASIRILLEKMNIELIEPVKSGKNGTCCGDSFYGKRPVDEVEKQMQKRASEMPEEDVVVYCVSCIKSMKIGGKTPLYLPDLIFNESTEAGECDLDKWHSDINEFISSH